MAQYRSKPRIIEAEQFLPEKFKIPAGVFNCYDNCGEVWTIHGQKTFVKSGDWIVTEPDGKSHYPVKPDIFAANYELIQ